MKTKFSIFFDFDGTLAPLDYDPLYLMAKDRDIDPSKLMAYVKKIQEEIKAELNKCVPGTFVICMDKNKSPYGKWALEEFQDVTKEYFISLAKRIKLFPESLELLRKLRELGHEIYLLTSNIPEIIGKSLPLDMFKDIFTTNLRYDEATGKPIDFKRTMFWEEKLKVIKAFVKNRDSSTIVYITDGDHDLEVMKYIKKNGGKVILLVRESLDHSFMKHSNFITSIDPSTKKGLLNVLRFLKID
jgi:phosphoserine phosphatase